MDYEQRKSMDISIFNKVIGCNEYKSSKKLFVYVSGKVEVDTLRIIEYSLDNGKAVMVPKCANESNLMEFYRIYSFDDLSNGSYGILEPDDNCEKITDYSNSCCIVPGLAYDCRGYRLGFGKGYYDRFFGIYSGFKLGVCYSNCIVNAVANDIYDKKVDSIITDTSLINIS